jgi:hypothetical protein
LFLVDMVVDLNKEEDDEFRKAVELLLKEK